MNTFSMGSAGLLLSVLMLAVVNFALTLRGLSFYLPTGSLGVAMAAMMSFGVVALMVAAGKAAFSQPFSYARLLVYLLVIVICLNFTSFYSFFAYNEMLSQDFEPMDALRRLLSFEDSGQILRSLMLAILTGMLTITSSGLLALQAAKPYPGPWQSQEKEKDHAWFTWPNVVFAVEVALAIWFFVVATVWWFDPSGDYEPQLAFVGALVAVIEIIKNRPPKP